MFARNVGKIVGVFHTTPSVQLCTILTFILYSVSVHGFLTLFLSRSLSLSVSGVSVRSKESPGHQQHQHEAVREPHAHADRRQAQVQASLQEGCGGHAAVCFPQRIIYRVGGK